MTAAVRESIIQESITTLDDEFIPLFEDMLTDCLACVRATTIDTMRRVLDLLEDIKTDLEEQERDC